MNEALVTTYFNRMSDGGAWSTVDDLVVKEILRQFLARVINIDTGHGGTLYREDKTAPNMTGLKDPYTDQVINIVDQEYIDNKYESGVSLYVSIMGLKTDAQNLEFPRGVQDTVVLQGLTVMCPEIRSGDVWKDTGTGKFYHLKPVKTHVAVKGIPVVAVMQMFELKETAPEYNLS